MRHPAHLFHNPFPFLPSLSFKPAKFAADLDRLLCLCRPTTDSP
jgi:hypothetical protein